MSVFSAYTRLCAWSALGMECFCVCLPSSRALPAPCLLAAAALLGGWWGSIRRAACPGSRWKMEVWRNYWNQLWLLKVTGLQGEALEEEPCVFGQPAFPRWALAAAAGPVLVEERMGASPEGTCACVRKAAALTCYCCVHHERKSQETVKSGVAFSVALCRRWKLWNTS